MTEPNHESLETLMRKALDELRKLGAHEAEMTYDGLGDSGNVETVTASSDKGAITLPDAIQSQLNDLAFRVIEWKKPGWELNEGSFGIVRFHVEDRAVELDHVWRREEGDSDWIDLDQRQLFDEQANQSCGLTAAAIPLA